MGRSSRDFILSDEVLEAEYNAVYRYVLSLTRNEADARDITQETCLRALKAADRFEGDSSLYTWLCAIAKNLWRNECNKNSRISDGEELTERLTDGISVEQLVTDTDMSMHIHKVLHGLDEPYKEVFTLRIFGGLPFQSIARLFSKTDSWARVTYHRARKMIITVLRKDGLI